MKEVVVRFRPQILDGVDLPTLAGEIGDLWKPARAPQQSSSSLTRTGEQHSNHSRARKLAPMSVKAR